MTAAFDEDAIPPILKWGDGRSQRRTVSVHSLQPKAEAYGHKDALRLASEPITAPNRTLSSTEDFLMALRSLRASSGTSFRDIELRSEKHLPKATAHKMVEAGQRKLPPRAEQVVHFVKACGGTSLDVKLWVDQWRRLKTMEAGKPVSVPEPPVSESVIPRVRTTLPIPEQEPPVTSWRAHFESHFDVSVKVVLALGCYTVFIVCLTAGIMAALSS